MPKLQDRAVINDIIYNELCLGIISSASRNKYLAIINNMINILINNLQDTLNQQISIYAVKNDLYPINKIFLP